MWSDSVLSMVVFESEVCSDNYTDLCVVLRCVFCCGLLLLCAIGMRVLLLGCCPAHTIVLWY